MSLVVACGAERNQIGFRIIAGLAAEFFVVHLKIRHCAARLTPPAITTQNLLSQNLVGDGIQPQGREFRANQIHDAFSLKP